MADKKKTDGKIITVNRKARHDYFVEETYECGISLAGTEVKSLRAGTVNLKDSYCNSNDGIHLGKEAYVAILEYIRTHAITD